MDKEFDIQGVFLSPVLVTAIIGAVVAFVVRRLLLRAGFYRMVWHPALFDAAMFVAVWALVATVPFPGV